MGASQKRSTHCHSFHFTRPVAVCKTFLEAIYSHPFVRMLYRILWQQRQQQLKQRQSHSCKRRTILRLHRCEPHTPLLHRRALFVNSSGAVCWALNPRTLPLLRNPAHHVKNALSLRSNHTDSSVPSMLSSCIGHKPTQNFQHNLFEIQTENTKWPNSSSQAEQRI